MRFKLLLLSLLFVGLFTLFSYSVAKEYWQKIDFDTTVKLQDHFPRKYDEIFSYFSLLGSVEITVGFCLILGLISIIKKKWLSFLGWLIIIPASLGEIFGKLILYHPSPPQFLHRSILPTSLPSFYIQTNFSYPSGHITRSIFIITVLLILLIFSHKKIFWKFNLIFFLLFLAFLMGLTRIYLGEHWLSDVLGGGLLGLATGFFALILII